MGDGLSAPSPRPPSTRRRRALAFAGLVAVVALGHLLATRELAERLAADGAASAAAMPARIDVAYVRTLEPQAPRAMAAPQPPALASPARAARAAARRVVAAAEAAEGASAPEPAASAVPAVDAAEAAAVAAVTAASAASAPLPALAAAEAAASTAATTAQDMATVAAAAASSPRGEGFAWPSATRVSYQLSGHWRGPLDGSAEVEWIRVGERYQVNVDIRAGPGFAPIFTRRMTSEGRLGAAGLVPDRYDEDTQVLMRERRRVSVGFEAEAVVLADGQRRARLAGVQDAASQFIQFTWLFGAEPERLRVGAAFEFPLALPRSLNRWTYDVAEEETLQAPFGPLATFHLKPRREARRPGEWLVEMWFAPELRFLPARIRIEQEGGAFVDLMIARKPELAAS